LTCETFQSQLMLSLATNETSDDIVVNRVLEAFKTFDVLLINQEGVISAHMDKAGIQRVDDEATLIENDDLSYDPSNRYIGVIIGFIVASVAVILSLLCIIQRRVGIWKRLNIARQRSHGDESSSEASKSEDSPKASVKSDFIMGTASTVSTPHCSPIGGSRDLRNEPEAPTVWTSEEALFWLSHPVGSDLDLEHVCSSATCRTCTIRQHKGNESEFFVRRLRPPTPPRSNTSYTRESVIKPCSRVYSDDPQRWYLIDDTVEL
jgi:hypothetical protein